MSGDEKKLKPMILKDIAEKVNMDISTISRVANSKYIDTPYGTKLLKTFFSEGLKNNEGEDVSSIEIKKILEQFIIDENKKKASHRPSTIVNDEKKRLHSSSKNNCKIQRATWNSCCKVKKGALIYHKTKKINPTLIGAIVIDG